MKSTWFLFLVVLGVSECHQYFSKESFEVDSSEHGVSPGKKTTSCKCGFANKEGSRVVGGKLAEQHEFPFIVTLVKRYEKVPLCSASIISPYHAITAAHCTIVGIKNKFDFNIIYAEHDWTKGVSKARAIAVSKFIQHENYDTKLLGNDISLLILAKKLPFSNIVGPVCLPNPKQPIDLTGKYVKLIGWGLTSHGGAGSPVLKEVNLRVLKKQDCYNDHSWSMFITLGKGQICTFGKAKGGCHGDSGGPVVYVDPETNRYTLIGIVSYGDVCAGPKSSVNVDVQYYLDWIQKQMNDNNPEKDAVCTKNV